ncbi:MAG: cation:proton antiporter [Rhodospirillum sp.]|nr:cation:proton antiporter [Rhodospirillum sp.]
MAALKAELTDAARDAVQRVGEVARDAVGVSDGTHDFIAPILVLLGLALVCVPLSARLRLGPVLGYLVAGAVVGPHGLGAVAEVHSVAQVAELGVVFLLFVIGLEVTSAKLAAVGRKTLMLGDIQITGTWVLGSLTSSVLGAPTAGAMVVGGALSLSSTAIVLMILEERGQLETRFGRSALAILLLQDMMVGPLLVLVTVLGKQGGTLGPELWMAFGGAGLKTIAAIALILTLGRLVLGRLFQAVAGLRSPELFAAMALLCALGTSWLTGQAGLSMAFGAFLAGFVLAETAYSHQIQADIEPFRGLLLGLFFMTVGMSIDVALAWERIGEVLVVLAALTVGKGAVVALAAMALGERGWRALRLGVVLSQGSEFAFVLLALALSNDLIPTKGHDILVLAVALSMAITPMLTALASHVLVLAERREAMAGGIPLADDGAGEGTEGHVIVVGLGEVGRIVSGLLKARGIPYLVLDTSPGQILEARARGEPVQYGDATVPAVLKASGAARAKAVVVATHLPEVAARLAHLAPDCFPNALLCARGVDEATVTRLREAGLREVVSETTDVGLRLAGLAAEAVEGDRP